MTKTELSVLVIDDLRYFAPPRPEITRLHYARTSSEAIVCLSEEEWDEVHFDFDLGAGDDTSMVIRAISSDKPSIGQCYVHSMNSVGAEALCRSLNALGYSVIRTLPSMFKSFSPDD